MRQIHKVFDKYMLLDKTPRKFKKIIRSAILDRETLPEKFEITRDLALQYRSRKLCQHHHHIQEFIRILHNAEVIIAIEQQTVDDEKLSFDYVELLLALLEIAGNGCCKCETLEQFLHYSDSD
jgi:hypothetical protein